MDHRTFCERVAREAGDIMRRSFLHDPETAWKADETPVTVADKEINRLVIEAVHETYPGHDIIGEEESSVVHRSGRVWVCDPVDGTIPFVRGIPTSVFSLALVEDGAPIAAVIYDPWCDRLCTAEKGKGTFLNGKPVRVSEQRGLDGCAIGITTFNRADYDYTGVYGELERCGGRNAFNLGSTAYMGMLVACGLLDAHIFPHHTVHDVAAQRLVVEEAGGRATDIRGNDQRYDGAVDGFVATNGLLHDEVLALLARCGATARRTHHG